MKLDISPRWCGDEYCNCFIGMYWDSPCPECRSTGEIYGFENYRYSELQSYDIEIEPINARCGGCNAMWGCDAPTPRIHEADEWEWERFIGPPVPERIRERDWR